MANTEATAAAVAPVARALEAAVPVTLTNRPSWYSITAKSDGDAEVKIYEDIGVFGVSAKQFTDDLEKIEASRISVRINSYGGEAFDGIAIYNALRAHAAEIVVHVDGIAASAASIIAMSGDEIRMADNAFLMIHEARGGVMGDAADMQKYAEMLDKLNDSIALTYQGRAGKSRKYWRDKMAEESWFTAEEAKSEGLADKVDDRETAAKNRFDFRVYNKVHDVPPAVLAAWGKPTQTPAPEAAPRGETPPAIEETPPMSETNQAPAPAPAAGTGSQPQAAPETPEQEILRMKNLTNQGILNQGKRLGAEEARKVELDRMKAIVAACPGKPQMAVDAFLSGQTPDAVKLAFDSAARAEAAAQTEIEALRREIHRKDALIANGGYPGGVGMGMDEGGAEEEETEVVDSAAAKARAEREWDLKPSVRKGFSNKDRYVAVRVAEMTGQLRTPVAATAQQA